MIATLVAHETRLLFKHGFVAAYAVITIVYSALLSALPPSWVDILLPVLAWSDPVFFGFFFVGASVCLDLSQGTFRALFAGPVSPMAYVAGKAGALSILSLVSTMTIAALSRGFSFSPLPLALAALCGTFLSGGIGMCFAIRLGTINRFMLASVPGMLALSLALVAYLPPTAPMAFVSIAAPSGGILALCRAAFGETISASPALGYLAAYALYCILVFSVALKPLMRTGRAA